MVATKTESSPDAKRVEAWAAPPEQYAICAPPPAKTAQEAPKPAPTPEPTPPTPIAAPAPAQARPLPESTATDDAALDAAANQAATSPLNDLPAPTGPQLKADQRPVRPEDKGGVLGEFGLSEEQGNEIIMAARAHWFEDEDASAGNGEDAVAEPST